ncbi:hypothetical protein OAN96_00460 [Candidatus Gracilibacteria bacterium]|nr:hypothetical protein [Candidatus Gracilibacteria bacterium]
MKNLSPKIAIFGGAFDPPTTGHTYVLSQVLNKTDVDKIILSPDGYRNDKQYRISMQHKADIAKLYIQELETLGLNVTLDTHFLEGKNNGPTTTMAVDQYFRDKYGNSIWHIFGSDVASEMSSWSGNTNQYLEKQLQKIFLARPGYPIEANKYGLENYEYLDTQFLENISSTIVRNMIKNKKNEVVDIIGSDEILTYIQDNNLYR